MINKIVTGVVAFSKYAQAQNKNCADKLQWSICIDAYRNGECHNFEGCDRTCGNCVGENDCYDRIPENHSFLFNQGLAAKAIWPNFSNQNSLPQVQYSTDDHFPFDRSAISLFCQNIFDNGQCDEVEGLKLTYVDSSGYDYVVDLYGSAAEYCSFTCGKCRETDGCWKTHNSNMEYLASLNACVDCHTNTMGKIDITSIFGGGEENTDIGVDNGWGEPDPWAGNVWDNSFETETESFDTEETDDADDGWGDVWGAGFAWGRKKRSATPGNMDKAEILTEAIESMIFPKFKDMLPLAARQKRSWSHDWMSFQQPTDHDEAERIKSEMKTCFKMNDAQETTQEETEEVAEEVEGEEEEGEDPYLRVRQMRTETDHEGMANWVADNTPEGTTLDGQCTNLMVPVEEPTAGMELAYYCKIKCAEGTPHVQHGEQLVLLDGEFQMKCSKVRHHRLKEAAVCSASKYCVGNSCSQVVCKEVESENYVYEESEFEEESFDDSWGAGGWGAGDFLY